MQVGLREWKYESLLFKRVESPKKTKHPHTSYDSQNGQDPVQGLSEYSKAVCR